MKYKLKETVSLENIENIFFVGIKGVGMTPLAIIAKEAGINIAGSDVGEEFITDNSLKKAAIEVFEGFDENLVLNFFKDCDKELCLVITTGAHQGFDNPQVRWAKENGYKVVSQGQALGEFVNGEIFDRDFKGIAVAGSHGKTTITSFLSSTMINLSEDVSYSVGTSEIFPTGLPGHYGRSEYFVVEADEYASEPVYDKAPKFLYIRPFIAIFNNIDFDHPDIFPSIEEVTEAFLEFSHNIQSGGKLFVNGDDELALSIGNKTLKDIKVITYGQSDKCIFRIEKIVLESSSSSFTVFRKDKEIGFFKINLPGLHNAKNALSVIAVLIELGYNPKKVKEALMLFKGSRRRLEEIGLTTTGSVIIDDYGHHPKEISASLAAIKSSHPDKKILCIFQPHTFSRTKALLSEFKKSFDNCNELIILPTFKSARDVEQDSPEIEQLVVQLKGTIDAIQINTFEGVIEYVEQNIPDNNWVIVTMGAGNVYKIGQKIKNDK